MDAQDFRSLQEAYLEVYQLDEEETGRGPRLIDTYDKPPYSDEVKDAPKYKPVIKGPKRKDVIKKEEVDLYDIILSHLLDEGYAETPEAAEVIMVNMSEDWKCNILEAKVDDDLSPEEKQRVRDRRSESSTFTRQNLNRVRRGKPTRGMKPPETTPAMTSVRKYEMALKHPETPIGRSVRNNIEMDAAERGPSGRRGS